MQFLEQTGWKDSRRTRVAGDASNRKYDRLIHSNGKTAILMDAAPEHGEDVRPFVRIAEYLNSIGLSAPKIISADNDAGFLLIEDFGDALFADLMQADQTKQIPLYKAAVDVLIKLHEATPLPLPVCDACWLSDMTAPVFEWYAQGSTPSLASEFADAFAPLAKACDGPGKVVILRDYHVQNLLWLPERTGVARVGVLDFQDALLGHAAYDLVSILQDARRDVDRTIETEMIAYYLSRTGVEKHEFNRAYALLGMQRNLRILGIFARLCLRDGKPSYVEFIPRVWNYIQRNLRHPDLAQLAEKLKPLPEPTPEFLEQLRIQCATSL